jgi:hypothetical protein
MNHNKRSARYYDHNRRGQAIIWWLQRTKSHLGLLLDMEWDIRIYANSYLWECEIIRLRTWITYGTPPEMKYCHCKELVS